MVMRFPAKKNAVAQKHRAISSQEKMAFPTPGRVALGLPPPPPPESVRAYAHVTTKIFRTDSGGSDELGPGHKRRYWRMKNRGVWPS